MNWKFFGCKYLKSIQLYNVKKKYLEIKKKNKSNWESAVKNH